MDFHATTQDAYASYSEEEYFERKCEYIPLSAKLIEHVRRLDSLSVSNFLEEYFQKDYRY